MRRAILLLATPALLFTGMRRAAAEPIITDPVTGNSFEFISTGGTNITWSAADAAAQALGGILAVVNTAEENAFVAAHVSPTQFNGFGLGPWLGGYSSVDDQNWNWVNGSTFPPNNGGPAFANWYNGQPDGFEGQPEGLLYYGGGAFGPGVATWGDYGQGGSGGTFGSGGGGLVGPVVGYVVEFQTPEPASITMLVSGLFAAGGFGVYRRRRDSHRLPHQF